MYSFKILKYAKNIIASLLGHKKNLCKLNKPDEVNMSI